MTTQHLFVYGTLLQAGNPFAVFLNKHCTFVDYAKVKGMLYDAGDYPGLIVDHSGNYVYGNIYQINDENVLPEIDAYEGVGEEQPNLYDRQLHQVEIGNRITAAWIYVYISPVAGLPLISSGNYLKYLHNKKSPGS